MLGAMLTDGNTAGNTVRLDPIRRSPSARSMTRGGDARRHVDRRQHRREHRPAGPDKTINIGHHRTTVGAVVYRNVEMADLLTQLSRQVKVADKPQRPAIAPGTLGPIVSGGDDAITADALYPRWADFLRPNYVIMTDTGSPSLGLAFAQLPKGGVSQPDPLGVYRMGDSGGFRCRNRCPGSPADSDHR